MLGDTMPLFFPVLILFLCLWLVANRVDQYCQRFSPMVEKRLISSYRIIPILMVAWLMIARARAIIERDVNHVEVANRLQGTNNDFSYLKLLISGDGVGEFALLFLLIFALWTINLPSMKQSPLTVRKAVQSRVMLYVAACTLLTFWIFFPESNYYAPESLPLQSTMSADGDYSILMVIVATLMVAFSGELFAIASIHNLDEHFIVLQRRALVKVYVVSGLLMFGLYQGNYLDTNWISQPGNEKIVATIILLSQTLILAFICIPSKRSDNLLRVGEGRTNSFAIMSILTLVILILVTSIVLRQTSELDSGNRFIEESLWLTASFTIMVSFTQLLPRYGFDAAARPEYWWLRITLLFSPAFIFWFNSLAIFIIPGLWLAASSSILIPNIVEKDTKTQSRLGLVILIASMITIIFITSMTENMLSNLLLFGSVPMIISNVVVQTIAND
jgi:hypothetical protein